MTVPPPSASNIPGGHLSSAADLDTAGLGGHLDIGEKPAVIVVDTVLAYAEPGSPLFLASAKQALESMAEVIGCARELGIPVLYTTVLYESSASTEAPIFARKVPALEVFRRGSNLADIHPTVTPDSDELVLAKQYASGFFKTALLDELLRLSRDTLIIVGFSTSGCVRATALDAIQHDFVPIVVRDAVADRTPEITSANLADLQTKYAEVMSSGEVLPELQRIARAMDEEGSK